MNVSFPLSSVAATESSRLNEFATGATSLVEKTTITSDITSVEQSTTSNAATNVSITETPNTDRFNAQLIALVFLALLIIGIGFLIGRKCSRCRTRGIITVGNYQAAKASIYNFGSEMMGFNGDISYQSILTDHDIEMSDLDTCRNHKVHVAEAYSLVGPDGATVILGGCRIVFPEGALDEEVEIHLTSSYGDVSQKNRLTPLLECEPHGLKFFKDVDVTLPTCFMTNGKTSVTAVARRSDDEMNWEDIKFFDHRTDRSFTFAIQSFSWYDVVVIPVMKYFDLLREKSVVCGIPHDYSDDPESLIMVCYIFDSLLQDNRLDCKKIYKTTLTLGRDEPDVTFLLSSDDVDVDPDNYRIPNARVSPEEEAHFTLQKKSINLIFHTLIIFIQTSCKDIERTFPIPPATRRAVAHRNAEGMDTTDTCIDANLSQVQNVCVGNGNVITTNYYGTASPAETPPTYDSFIV